MGAMRAQFTRMAFVFGINEGYHAVDNYPGIFHMTVESNECCHIRTIRPTTWIRLEIHPLQQLLKYL